MKKVFSFLLVFLISVASVLLLAIPANAESGVIGGFTWSYDPANATLMITGSGEMPNMTSDTVAPWEDLPFTTLIIGDNVTLVGAWSFANSEHLERLILGKNLRSIQQYAFYSCDNLKQIEFGEKIHSVWLRGFGACKKLEHVSFPSSLRFGLYAFEYCLSLKSVEVWDVSALDTNFGYCNSLKDIWFVDIPKDTTIRIDKGFENVNEKLLSANYHFVESPCDSHCDKCSLARVAGNHKFQGAKDKVCMYCAEVAPHTHQYGDVEQFVPSTCVAAGKEQRTCLHCDSVLESLLPLAKHNYSETSVTKEATCTETGIQTSTCSTCGVAKNEAVTAKGHSFGEGVVTKSATETEKGKMTFTCSLCQETKEEEIPAIFKNPTKPSENPATTAKEQKEEESSSLVVILTAGASLVLGIAAFFAWYFLIYKKK